MSYSSTEKSSGSVSSAESSGSSAASSSGFSSGSSSASSSGSSSGSSAGSSSGFYSSSGSSWPWPSDSSSGSAGFSSSSQGCDITITGIRLEVIAGPGNAGWFTVNNLGAADVEVVAYTGPGSISTFLPVTIVAGGSAEFLVFESGDSLPSQAFTITTTECGVSASYAWPAAYP